MSRTGFMFVLVLLGACAYDRDALYEPAAGRALPLLPFTPDTERRDACSACATEHCGPERDACVADAECVELLRCRGKCSNPECFSRCGSQALYDPMGQRPLALGTFGDYLACVSTTQCVSECGPGRNWGCLGQYDWPAAEDPLNIPVQVEIASGTPVVWSLRWAAGSFPQTVETDGWGQAEINLGARSTAPTAGFGGVLELESGRLRFLSYLGMPLTRPSRVVIPLLYGPLEVQYARQPASPVVEALGSPPPELGLVQLVALDCLGMPAPGIAFEIETAATRGATYYLSGGTFSATASETAAPDPRAFVVDVREGLATLRARRTDTMELIREKRGVEVRERWFTQVFLLPATASE